MTRGAAALVALSALACAAERGTIGALLAQDRGGRLVVREAPEGLGADRAAVRPGDEILLIDGRDVRRMSHTAVHEALSGEVGEPVKLTLIRGEEVVRVTVRRTKAQRRKKSAGPEPEPRAPRNAEQKR